MSCRFSYSRKGLYFFRSFDLLQSKAKVQNYHTYESNYLSKISSEQDY